MKRVGISFGSPSRRSDRLSWMGALLLCMGAGACASGGSIPPPAAPLSLPNQLCTQAEQSACLSATDVEDWLRSSPLSILGVGETPGSSGAKILTLRVSTRDASLVTLRAKWREHKSSFFNDARKEIAAYATQKLVFEPHEYIVPPTVGRCFPLARYRALLDAESDPNLDDTQCVFGSLSYWLEHVTSSKPYSEQRFWEDVEYRSAVADVNLFTYLIQHGDTHGGNFVVSDAHSSATGRIYSADNSIAFSPFLRNPRDLFGSNWYELRVPGLRREIVERLADVTRAELEGLSVIEQYRVENGQLIPTATTPAPPSDSAIRHEGQILQLGLTETEIDQLEERIDVALERVASGELVLF